MDTEGKVLNLRVLDVRVSERKDSLTRVSSQPKMSSFDSSPGITPTPPLEFQESEGAVSIVVEPATDGEAEGGIPVQFAEGSHGGNNETNPSTLSDEELTCRKPLHIEVRAPRQAENVEEDNQQEWRSIADGMMPSSEFFPSPEMNHNQFLGHDDNLDTNKLLMEPFSGKFKDCPACKRSYDPEVDHFAHTQWYLQLRFASSASEKPFLAFLVTMVVLSIVKVAIDSSGREIEGREVVLVVLSFIACIVQLLIQYQRKHRFANCHHDCNKIAVVQEVVVFLTLIGLVVLLGLNSAHDGATDPMLTYVQLCPLYAVQLNPVTSVVFEGAVLFIVLFVFLGGHGGSWFLIATYLAFHLVVALCAVFVLVYQYQIRRYLLQRLLLTVGARRQLVRKDLVVNLRADAVMPRFFLGKWLEANKAVNAPTLHRYDNAIVMLIMPCDRARRASLHESGVAVEAKLHHQLRDISLLADRLAKSAGLYDFRIAKSFHLFGADTQLWAVCETESRDDASTAALMVKMLSLVYDIYVHLRKVAKLTPSEGGSNASGNLTPRILTGSSASKGELVPWSSILHMGEASVGYLGAKPTGLLAFGLAPDVCTAVAASNTSKSSTISITETVRQIGESSPECRITGTDVGAAAGVELFQIREVLLQSRGEISCLKPNNSSFDRISSSGSLAASNSVANSTRKRGHKRATFEDVVPDSPLGSLNQTSDDGGVDVGFQVAKSASSSRSPKASPTPSPLPSHSLVGGNPLLGPQHGAKATTLLHQHQGHRPRNGSGAVADETSSHGSAAGVAFSSGAMDPVSPTHALDLPTGVNDYESEPIRAVYVGQVASVWPLRLNFRFKPTIEAQYRAVVRSLSGSGEALALAQHVARIGYFATVLCLSLVLMATSIGAHADGSVKSSLTFVLLLFAVCALALAMVLLPLAIRKASMLPRILSATSYVLAAPFILLAGADQAEMLAADSASFRLLFGILCASIGANQVGDVRVIILLDSVFILVPSIVKAFLWRPAVHGDTVFYPGLWLDLLLLVAGTVMVIMKMVSSDLRMRHTYINLQAAAMIQKRTTSITKAFTSLVQGVTPKRMQDLVLRSCDPSIHPACGALFCDQVQKLENHNFMCLMFDFTQSLGPHIVAAHTMLLWLDQLISSCESVTKEHTSGDVTLLSEGSNSSSRSGIKAGRSVKNRRSAMMSLWATATEFLLAFKSVQASFSSFGVQAGFSHGTAYYGLVGTNTSQRYATSGPAPVRAHGYATRQLGEGVQYANDTFIVDAQSFDFATAGLLDKETKNVGGSPCPLAISGVVLKTPGKRSHDTSGPVFEATATKTTAQWTTQSPMHTLERRASTQSDESGSLNSRPSLLRGPSAASGAQGAMSLWVVSLAKGDVPKVVVSGQEYKKDGK